MFHRNIYPELEEHLESKHATVINGMRRVGKSTAVKHLLSKVKHENKVYFDCERIEIRSMFNIENYEEIKQHLEFTGLNFNKPCVIALDEIQLLKNLPSFIKYMYDTYKVKFIVTGTSSFYMKNHFGESLAGRKKIFEMYPLTFDEFLHFKNARVAGLAKYKMIPFNKLFYNHLKDLYAEYIQFGGFPEVVLSKRIKDKNDLLKDILNSYIEMDIKLLNDYTANDELYKLVKLLTTRIGSKLDISKLSSVSGISRHKLTAYIELFKATYFLFLIRPFTRNTDKEISSQPKIYFSDTGILNQLGSIDKGALFENAIACQLYQIGTLNYYQKKTGQEIDFILNQNTAIEVKQTPISQDSIKLERRAQDIGLNKKMLIGNQPAESGFTEFIWGGNVFK